MGRYDAALRDWKKGRFLVESRGLFEESKSKSINGKEKENGGGKEKDAREQDRRILEKVWEQVERVMDELRALLLEKLSGASLGGGPSNGMGGGGRKNADEYERTIESVFCFFFLSSKE